MSENCKFSRSKTALLEIELELSVLQTSQDMVEAFEMGCEIWRKDNNVVEVAETYVPLETPQNRVHHALEGGRRIAKAEGHEMKLI